MEIIDRFRQEYKAHFRRELEDYMKDLGFQRVTLRLSLDGNPEDLTVEGPGYSAANNLGYRRLETILKELKQKYNIRLETEKKEW